jgi:hypothetical protein
VICRVTGCLKEHANNLLCCRGHWFALPTSVRDEIWRLYRTAPGSDAHREAALNALKWLDEKYATNYSNKPIKQVRS